MEPVEAHRNGEAHRDWVVKRHLSAEALNAYIRRLSIERSQVVAVTEPADGTFTLIFEPNDEQSGYLEAEAGQVAETLDTLFGAPVTPAFPEQAAAPPGEAVPVIVAVPTAPQSDPTVPLAEPSPS